MSRRFLILFVVTITLGLLAFATTRSALDGGGPLPASMAIAFGAAAALGLALLIRIAYLDGRARDRPARRQP